MKAVIRGGWWYSEGRVTKGVISTWQRKGPEIVEIPVELGDSEYVIVDENHDVIYRGTNRDAALEMSRKINLCGGWVYVETYIDVKEIAGREMHESDILLLFGAESTKENGIHRLLARPSQIVFRKDVENRWRVQSLWAIHLTPGQSVEVIEESWIKGCGGGLVSVTIKKHMYKNDGGKLVHTVTVEKG